jgi:hypothetical protein
MGLRLFARDAFKRWLKTLHKSTDLNGSDIQNPSSLTLGFLSFLNFFEQFCTEI